MAGRRVQRAWRDAAASRPRMQLVRDDAYLSWEAVYLDNVDPWLCSRVIAVTPRAA